MKLIIHGGFFSESKTNQEVKLAKQRLIGFVKTGITFACLACPFGQMRSVGNAPFSCRNSTASSSVRGKLKMFIATVKQQKNRNVFIGGRDNRKVPEIDVWPAGELIGAQ